MMFNKEWQLSPAAMTAAQHAVTINGQTTNAKPGLITSEANLTAYNQQIANIAGLLAGLLIGGQLLSINPVSLFGNALMQSDSIGQRVAGLVLNTVGNSIVSSAISGAVNNVAKSVTENVAKEGLKNGLKGAVGKSLSGIGSGLKSGALSRLKSLASPSMGVGLALSVADSMLGTKEEYSGDKGGITKGLDTAYDAISSGITMIPGVGWGVGAALQGAKVLGKAVGKLGAYTSSMTAQDAILGSSFFNWNIGAINGAAGKNTDSYFSNSELMALTNGGYQGFLGLDSRAAHVQGKRYGLLSRGAYKDAQEAVQYAQGVKNIVQQTVDYNTLNNLAALGNMNAVASQYSNDLSGGMQQMRAAKHGMKMSFLEIGKRSNDVTPIVRAKQFLSLYKLIKAQEGSKLANFLKSEKPKKVESDLSYYDPETDTIYYSGKERKDLEEAYKHEYVHSRPDEYSELFDYLRPYYENLNDDKISELGGNLEFVKRFNGDPNHFYNPEELVARIVAASYRTRNVPEYSEEFFENLRLNENEYGDNMRDLLHMYNNKNLSLMFKYFRKPDRTENLYILQSLAFKSGGQMNVIPEGALHARLHHLDEVNPELAKEITNKGIPVITEDEDGKVTQHAEIEHSEIIYTLEVTNKLEELRKLDKEHENDDSYAIEAGKLITQETLYNTDDRMGLIKNIEL